MSLAQTITDALLDRGVKARLQLEAPTAIERGQQQAELLNQLLGPSAQPQGSVTDMLKQIPVGVSVTIRFEHDHHFATANPDSKDFD